MANGRVLGKELDTRLKAVEDTIGDIAERVLRIERGSINAGSSNGGARSENGTHQNGSDTGKIAELESMISRLEERIEKIARSIVEQASRYS